MINFLSLRRIKDSIAQKEEIVIFQIRVVFPYVLQILHSIRNKQMTMLLNFYCIKLLTIFLIRTETKFVCRIIKVEWRNKDTTKYKKLQWQCG